MVKDILLQILDGNNLKEYRFENFNKEYITFGRNSEQDIVLKNIHVSRKRGHIKKLEMNGIFLIIKAQMVFG